MFSPSLRLSQLLNLPIHEDTPPTGLAAHSLQASVVKSGRTRCNGRAQWSHAIATLGGIRERGRFRKPTLESHIQAQGQSGQVIPSVLGKMWVY